MKERDERKSTFGEASKVFLTTSKPEFCFYSGKSRKPYWPRGVRCTEGVTLIWAFPVPTRRQSLGLKLRAPSVYPDPWLTGHLARTR